MDLNLCTLSQFTLNSVQCFISHFDITNAKSTPEEIFLDSWQFIGNIFVFELFFFIYTTRCESKWFGLFCGGIKSANCNVKWILYTVCTSKKMRVIKLTDVCKACKSKYPKLNKSGHLWLTKNLFSVNQVCV